MGYAFVTLGSNSGWGRWPLGFVFSETLRLPEILRLYLFIFRENGREGERRGEKHQCMREASISFLLPGP